LWITGDNQASVWVARVLLPARTQSVSVVPPELDWELPAGLGRLTCTTRQRRLEDGRLEIELRRSVYRGSAVVAPELYPALLEMNRRLTHPEMQTIVARLGDQ
jgi:hypothetical protein